MEDATTTTGRGGNKRTTLKIALIVTGVLVLAGVAAVAVWWQQQNDDRSSQPDPMAQMTEQVQNDILSGEYDKAHETINKALDSSNLSDIDKYNLYIQQGSVYESQQNYEAAMESYRKAEAIQEDVGIVYAIANVAQVMGDKELAARYFRKAIPLISEDDPMKEQRKLDFENWARILEGQEPIYEER
jgi:tetratricopeptide (TPR) repeat protein